MQRSMQGACFEDLVGHQKLALEKAHPVSQVAIMKTKNVDPSLLATSMGRPVVLPGKSNETEPIQTVTVRRPVCLRQ